MIFKNKEKSKGLAGEVYVGEPFQSVAMFFWEIWLDLSNRIAITSNHKLLQLNHPYFYLH